MVRRRWRKTPNGFTATEEPVVVAGGTGVANRIFQRIHRRQTRPPPGNLTLGLHSRPPRREDSRHAAGGPIDLPTPDRAGKRPPADGASGPHPAHASPALVARTVGIGGWRLPRSGLVEPRSRSTAGHLARVGRPFSPSVCGRLGPGGGPTRLVGAGLELPGLFRGVEPIAPFLPQRSLRRPRRGRGARRPSG